MGEVAQAFRPAISDLESRKRSAAARRGVRVAAGRCAWPAHGRLAGTNVARVADRKGHKVYCLCPPERSPFAMFTAQITMVTLAVVCAPAPSQSLGEAARRAEEVRTANNGSLVFDETDLYTVAG